MCWNAVGKCSMFENMLVTHIIVLFSARTEPQMQQIFQLMVTL
jgi:hypothetical protein